MVGLLVFNELFTFGQPNSLLVGEFQSDTCICYTIHSYTNWHKHIRQTNTNTNKIVSFFYEFSPFLNGMRAWVVRVFVWVIFVYYSFFILNSRELALLPYYRYRIFRCVCVCVETRVRRQKFFLHPTIQTDGMRLMFEMTYNVEGSSNIECIECTVEKSSLLSTNRMSESVCESE